MPMFGPIETFSKILPLQIFLILPILETERNRDVAPGLGGGNISKIVPIGPL